MIPTFNCANTLEETLRSVLQQAPGPGEMQIEVVDDHSTLDDPAALVQRVAGRRVAFHRQSRNIGVAANLTACVQRSIGRIVHILHGDDRVEPGFYRKMQAAFAAVPDLGAAYCRQKFIDVEGRMLGMSPLENRESGLIEDAVVHLALEQRIMTPSICVARTVYEDVGGFDHRLECSEDWEMWVRIASRWPVWYEVEPLAAYRMHTHSNTGRNTRTGRDIDFTLRAIDIIAGHVPPQQADRVRKQARRTYAKSALLSGRQALARGDLGTAWAQGIGARRLSASPDVLTARLVLLARIGMYAAWRRLAGGTGAVQ
jgi:glycosyltransferase involved in cell wall biosynthesis